MRADEQRRVPVPFVGGLACRRLRREEHSFLRAPIIAHEAAILVLRIDNVRIARIDLRFVSVAAQNDVPIGIRDPVYERGARGAAQ